MMDALDQFMAHRRLAREYARAELTPEQQDLQRAAREFASAEFPGVITADPATEKTFPHALLAAYAELGMTAVDVAEEYGGAGYGLTEKALCIIEDCRADSTIGLAFSLVSIISDVLAIVGDEEQKKRWLPLIVEGRCFPAISLTEPDHGSDLTRFNTRAEIDGEKFVLDGVKVFTTYGLEADYFIVAAQTDASAPDYEGFSTILVERDRPGVGVASLGDKLGIKMTTSAEVVFCGVRVPRHNLVGELHRGIETLNRFFAKSRVKIAAQALGVALGAFEAAFTYATRERRQTGRFIGEYRAVAEMLDFGREAIARMWKLLLRAARNYDAGGPFDPTFLAALAKLECSNLAERVVRLCLQIFGGYGYMREGNPADVERRLRDVVITTIYEGTNQIMEAIIRGHLRQNPHDRHLIHW
ncbi:MAG: acyl-CoA dehydrogenase family protein [Proteobacteria bacterium]|nr:acyl-CoA dehydrogenase family protein [Pseudomonadota bacterium]